jgi:glycosyltransferase involved in cell wall biosynthesis
LHVPRVVTGDPMRVAIVAASVRILGGQAVQAQRLLAGWQNDPDVFAWLVPVNPIPPRPLSSLLRFKYVRTIVTQVFYWPLLFRELLRADVVHVFSASYSAFVLSTLPAVIVARMLDRPVVLNYHSGEAPDHLRRSWTARLVMRHLVDLNVVPSQFLRDVLARFGIDARVVTNTVDRRMFPFRERHPLRPRLLSTRNLEPMYNVACVLRAFGIVQAHHPDAALTVVGFGSQEAELRRLAADLGLRRVTFTGKVRPEDVARYHADADIYIQTPAIDNMPLSVLEAYASGLPVVSTNVGGVPAILTHGVHGLLAADDDDAAVAARVMDLLDAPDEARRMAAAAYESCALYDWTVAREGWLAAYAAAANGFTPGPVSASPATRETA